MCEVILRCVKLVNSIYSVYSINHFSDIAQDLQSVVNRLAPPIEMYTPLMAEYLSDLPMSWDMSIFETPVLPDYQPIPIIYNPPKTEHYTTTRDNRTDSHSTQAKTFHSPVAFEGLPVVGKLNSVPEKIIDKNYMGASALWSLAALNGPEELRDVFEAYKQVKAFCTGKKYNGLYNFKEYQHPFSFFRGTLLHKFLNPNNPKNKFKKLTKFIVNNDKSLIETKLGHNFLQKAKISMTTIDTSIKDITYTDMNKAFVNAYKFTGKSTFGKLTARAMTRTPVIGLAVSGGIEGINAMHEINKGKNPVKEIGKAVVRWGSSAALTGVLGAIGSTFGPVGTIIGMGLGSIASAAIGNAIA